jgi:hypothetical protein
MRAIALLLVGLTITISSPASAESLLRKLLRVTGISATPSQQKSPGQEMESGGVIWVSDVATKTAHKLSDESGFRSPIFAPNDQAILAVRAGTLWQISLPDGSAKKLHEVAGLTKLVGIDQDDSDKVLVLLRRESALVPARLSLASGATTEISYDPKSSDDRKLLTHLKEWERVYGETKVYPQAQRREGIAGLVEWQDVFLKKGDAEAVNLSHCEGDNCGQPSLSNNQTTVVFVRAKP